MEPEVFSKAVALATRDSVLRLCATVLSRDFRSLLLWFSEITFPPRGILLPPSVPGELLETGMGGADAGLRGSGWLCEGEEFISSQQERSPRLGLTRAEWRRQAEGDSLGPQKFHDDYRGLKFSCWLVWGSPHFWSGSSWSHRG